MKQIYDRIDEKTGEIKSRGVRTINEEPSLTQQQFKDSCDVNLILKTYMTTGQISHLNSKTGVYADLTSIGSYQTMLNTIISADNAFMELPAELRLKFKNNPQELINFLADTKNDDEAISLGLKVKPKVEPKLSDEIADAIVKHTPKKPSKNALPPDSDV